MHTNIFLKKTGHRLRCFTKGNLDKQTGQQCSNSGKYRCPVDACILVTKWCKTVQELQYTVYLYQFWNLVINLESDLKKICLRKIRSKGPPKDLAAENLEKSYNIRKLAHIFPMMWAQNFFRIRADSPHVETTTRNGPKHTKWN